ncbi:Aminoglycoside phosphotransferase [Niveomyces insectorum RCEF 264]|uniref:Aminoglycoside phosphotransferase n=1 Tax=Niveomyces insectorum RCEF 264 TaxID=1081102 RepID=A0A167U3C0_9HYPO|nr:Aminoglycoside phosphotransferase [Niveomyces insectorum RCEF 264]
MPETIRTGIHQSFSFEDALDDDHNIVQKHLQWEGFVRFLDATLCPKQKILERLVAFQLGVDAARVQTRPREPWFMGTFNIAAPMLIHTEPRARPTPNAIDDAPATAAAGVERTPDILVRCPLPNKCAEAVYPGSVEEKMRGEVAAYVWMQRYCPDVRIPFLYGFAFPGGRHFSHCSRVSFFRRLWLRVRQFAAALLCRPVPSDYLPLPVPSSVFWSPLSEASQKPGPVDFGYMILEFLGPSVGRPLPHVVGGQSMPQARQDHPGKVDNLFRSIARIMLALARRPQPRIASFSFHDDGTIALDHRPLSCDMILLENEGAPRTMAPTQTYTWPTPYVADLLAFHDAQFRAAPNAAHDRTDFVAQTAARAFLQAVTHHFVHTDSTGCRASRPYVLQFSDGNAANMMLDADWNVTAVFDLEWLMAGPVELLAAPLWLTWTSVDVVAGEGYDVYNDVRNHFVKIFEEEEAKATKERYSHAQDTVNGVHTNNTDCRALSTSLPPNPHPLADAMQDNWASERFWFFRCLLSVNALHHVVQDRLKPVFYPKGPLPRELHRLWDPAVDEVMEAKLRDRRAYVVGLVHLFKREPPPAEDKKGEKGVKEEQTGLQT